MKIVVTDAATVTAGDISLEFLKKFGELTVYDDTEDSEIKERIKDADMVLCNKTEIGEKELSGSKVKYIGLFATGYNNIDVKYAAVNGITVCNVPGYSTEAVAQHTFALILAAVNRVGEYNETVKQGDWIKSKTFAYFPFPTAELCGKTIGIVGYGSIGRRVGDIARAFGMRVLAFSRHPFSENGAEYAEFDRIFGESDIITLHCPLNDDSRLMINSETIAKMKDGAVLINTARGKLVDEYALRDALISGKISAAGLDVLTEEPMSRDCPLYLVKNCYITPHVAWAGLETRERLMGVIEENIKAYINNAPINKVN